MRKRWTFNPRPWIALWAIGGIVGLFVTAILADACGPKGCGINGPWTTAETIEVAVWLGPFVLYVLSGIIVVTLPHTIRIFWEARPKRIIEPILDDLREIVTVTKYCTKPVSDAAGGFEACQEPVYVDLDNSCYDHAKLCLAIGCNEPRDWDQQFCPIHQAEPKRATASDWQDGGL